MFKKTLSDFAEKVFHERFLLPLMIVMTDSIYCSCGGDGVIMLFHKYNKEKKQRMLNGTS